MPPSVEALVALGKALEDEFGRTDLEMKPVGLSGNKWVITTPGELCNCGRCDEEFRMICNVSIFDVPYTFIVCSICGNKRCPKAMDHRFRCSHSNKSGQIGQLEKG